MSYPQFNLTTLQLPAPASNMTKAEYKSAYGIDLDQVNIRALKLVLFGNEKYPIDKIKVVEDGYEIYFNGRVLSITDIVQTSDEIYDVENAKPIYFHPVRFNISGSIGAQPIRCVNASIMILNNSPTTLDSFDKLRTYLYNEGENIDVLCSIDIFDDDSKYIGQILKLTGLASVIRVILTYNGSTTVEGTFNGTELTNVNDAVNKIN